MFKLMNMTGRMQNSKVLHNATVEISRKTKLRNYFVVGSAGGLSQLISLVFLPVVTRVYTVNQIGDVVLYSSLIAFFTTFACLRFDTAIPLPSSDGIAHELRKIAFLAGAGSSVILTGLLLTLKYLGVALPTSPNALTVLLIGGMLVGSSLFTISISTLIRARDYKMIMWATLSNISSQYLIQVGIGLFHHGRIGLQIGFALSGVIGSLVARIGLQIPIERDSLRTSYREYRGYSIRTSISAALSSVVAQAPLLFIGYNFGSRMIALTALSQMSIGAPLSLVSQSVSQVTLGNNGKRDAHLDELLERELTKTYRFIIIFGVILLLLAIGFTSLLAQPVLGKEWGDLWKVVALTGPAIVLQAAVNPFGIVPDLSFRPRDSLFRDIGRAAITMMTLLGAFYFLHEKWFAISLISAGSIASSFWYKNISSSGFKHRTE